jgi:L-asparaginase / beta-aspartyl-peptidase
MKYFALILIAFLMTHCSADKEDDTKANNAGGPISIVIHGGAGVITRGTISREREAKYHEALKTSLDSGYSVLEKGGTSVDAVLVTIRQLEDSPLFNAGKGAVFNFDGGHELDASIMEGKNLQAGAVAGVRTLKNPINAAHAVMTRSEHVMLSGVGAENFAVEQGLETVSQDYFFDSLRYNQWRRSQRHQAGVDVERKFGTVGCVALDKFGNIAAGTSTGGMTNKNYGRIGDAPIIGAGVYANNTTCGISSTGWGEFFIRLGVAFDISALMEYKGLSLEEAAQKVVMEKLTTLGGTGGIVGLSRKGEIVMTFNTEGMYRGYKRQGEAAKTFIFKEDD